MKKILLFATGLTVLFAACKKDDESGTTMVVAPSYPTIDFGSGGQFFSINTGGSLPTVNATAYDSTLKESYPVTIVGTEALDASTPGLYVVSAKATNKYGYYSKQNVYVAVTDVSPTCHLEGDYVRAATSYTVHVKRLANGLYSTSNFFGVSGLDADAYFAHLNDTTITMPPQDTELGHLETSNNKLHMAPGDTTYSYVLQTLTTNRSVRTFKKK